MANGAVLEGAAPKEFNTEPKIEPTVAKAKIAKKESKSGKEGIPGKWLAVGFVACFIGLTSAAAGGLYMAIQVAPADSKLIETVAEVKGASTIIPTETKANMALLKYTDVVADAAEPGGSWYLSRCQAEDMEFDIMMSVDVETEEDFGSVGFEMGVVGKQDGQNMQGDMTIEISVMGFSADVTADVIMIDEKMYFKMTEVPEILITSIAEEYDEYEKEDIEELLYDEWYLYDQQELMDMMPEDVLEELETEIDYEQLEEYQERISKYWSEGDIVDANFLAEETVRGVTTYKYKMNSDEDGLNELIDEVLIGVGESIDADEDWDEIAEYIEVTNVDYWFWIDESGEVVRERLKLGLEIDDGTEKVEIGFTYVGEYWNVGEDQTVDAPEEYRSIFDLLKDFGFDLEEELSSPYFTGRSDYEGYLELQEEIDALEERNEDLQYGFDNRQSIATPCLDAEGNIGIWTPEDDLDGDSAPDLNECRRVD